ncbi:MAG: bile acid:sodium symporter [Polyangiaceae bacterium]|nr:bile acid:sodium symporter [Polyangiaceae bacterium]
MRSAVEKNLLILVIALALMLATLEPAFGMALEALGLTQVFIVGIFVLQGLGLDVSAFRRGSELIRSLIWGALVAYGLGPVLGYALLGVVPLADSDRVGFLLMCCTTPTIVSGIVVATRAGGDAAAALFLTVFLNALGILTLPFNLSWTLAAIYPIDQAALFKKLFFYILLPSLFGLGLRRRFPSIIEPTLALRRHGPVLLLGMTVLLAVSPHADVLRQLSLGHLLGLLWPALLVHGLLLAFAYGFGRIGWRLGRSVAISTAFVTSQKSLPVTLAVWSTVFATKYPLALLPALIFHPAQIIFDGFIARWAHKPAVDHGADGQKS